MIFNFDFRTPRNVQGQVRLAMRNRCLALNMTQKKLAEKSGMPLSTLKQFEQTGEISFAGLLAIAGAINALEKF